jgi:antitoxin ParD1/3/4
MNFYKYSMTQLNVSVPPQLKTWVDTRVAEGRYSSASDYVRDLLRRDQDAAMDETEWLRGLIDEGLASGRLNQRPEDVLREIMSEYPAKNG